ncbi:MAG: hypothetical protein ACLTZY_06655 [Alistipes indistinctus]
MKIYKFGGASVRSAKRWPIFLPYRKGEARPLFIVVSAMGKTTNALELVLEDFIGGNTASALDRLRETSNITGKLWQDCFIRERISRADGTSAGTNRVGALFPNSEVCLRAAS